MHAHPIADDAGEIKAQRKKSTLRISDLWYPRYPRIFREATDEMDFDLRAYYGLVIDLYFERGGPLPDNDALIARGLGCDIRKWRPIREQLFHWGKLHLGADGMIHNEKADEILAERQAKMAKRGVSATKEKRRRTPSTTPGSTYPTTPATTSVGSSGDFFEKPKEIKGTVVEIAAYARATKSLDVTEEISSVCPRPPKSGFTELAHGAWVDGETIWHPKFTISLRAAHMQFSLNPNLIGMDHVEACKAAAIQWAAAIEGGQNSDKVIPGNIVGAIMGSARKTAYGVHEHQARLARAAQPYASSSNDAIGPRAEKARKWRVATR